MATTTATDSAMAVDAPPSTQQTFRVGTRRSLLARIQADMVVKALREAWPDYKFDIHAMATAGDNDQTTALHKFNEKSLWTQDLEILLQNNELDLIVHSLKDVPTQLPVDLEIGCITKRHDARDALVIKNSLRDKYHSLADLPPGSVVGTSSLRRIAQLKRNFPHLEYQSVRGNINTRLAKLDDPASPYAGIIIAAAGFERGGLGNRIDMYLNKSHGSMLHAVGQGALGIEMRKGDEKVRDLLKPISCSRTTRVTLAERSLMRTLEGGCSVPIGVQTEWVKKKDSVYPDVAVGVKPNAEYDHVTGLAVPSGDVNRAENEEDDLTDELLMHAIVISLDGSEASEIEARRQVRNEEEADQFGWDAAKMLVERGADKILENITLQRDVVQKQGNA